MEAEIERYRQQHASPEAVFNWLRDKYPLALERRDASHFHAVERDLLKRDDPLINLGLALYSNAPGTTYPLYRSGIGALELAVLSGRSLNPGIGESWLTENGVIQDIVADRKMDHLRVLFSNPNLPDELFIALFERSDAFASLDYADWLVVLHGVARHPRLGRPLEGTSFDGWSEYNDSLVFMACWKLGMSLDTDPKSAMVFASLTDNLVAVAPPHFDVWAAIERWRIDPPETEAIGFMWCRRNLARLTPSHGDAFEALKSSSDPGLRASYYERFSPRSAEEVHALFARDGTVFLDGAIQNPTLFRQEALFSALSECCWDAPDPYSSMDYPRDLESARQRFGEPAGEDEASGAPLQGGDAERMHEDVMSAMDALRREIATLSKERRDVAEPQAHREARQETPITPDPSARDGGRKASPSPFWARLTWVSGGIIIGLAFDFIFFSP